MSKLYEVKWVIEIEANSAEKAANEAWEIIKECPNNEASNLDIYDIEDDKLLNSFDMNGGV